MHRQHHRRAPDSAPLHSHASQACDLHHLVKVSTLTELTLLMLVQVRKRMSNWEQAPRLLYPSRNGSPPQWRSEPPSPGGWDPSHAAGSFQPGGLVTRRPSLQAFSQAQPLQRGLGAGWSQQVRPSVWYTVWASQTAADPCAACTTSVQPCWHPVRCLTASGLHRLQTDAVTALHCQLLASRLRSSQQPISVVSRCSCPC